MSSIGRTDSPEKYKQWPSEYLLLLLLHVVAVVALGNKKKKRL
jgi:hypothetical protein